MGIGERYCLGNWDGMLAGFASDSLTGCLVDGRIRTVDVAACIALRFALRFFAVASRFLRAYYEYGSDCGYRSTYDEKCLRCGGGRTQSRAHPIHRMSRYGRGKQEDRRQECRTTS